MDDLIRRRDALNCSHIVYIEFLKTDEGGHIKGDADCIPVVKKRDIESIPAVDAVEVVHGEWIKSKYPGFAFCSICNNCYIQTEFIEQSKGGSTWKYCPDCGARMDGEEEQK